MAEKLHTLVARDRDSLTKGHLEILKCRLEELSGIQIVHTGLFDSSGTIWEIKNKEVDLVVAAVSVLTKSGEVHQMKFDELKGFLRKAKKRTKRYNLSTKVVVCTQDLHDTFVDELFDCGADAWVCEELAPEYLAPALVNIVQGESYVNPMVKIKSLTAE